MFGFDRRTNNDVESKHSMWHRTMGSNPGIHRLFLNEFVASEKQDHANFIRSCRYPNVALRTAYSREERNTE